MQFRRLHGERIGCVHCGFWGCCCTCEHLPPTPDNCILIHIVISLSQLIGSTLALEYLRAEYVAPLGSMSLIFNFLFASMLVGTPVTSTDIYVSLKFSMNVLYVLTCDPGDNSSDLGCHRYCPFWFHQFGTRIRDGPCTSQATMGTSKLDHLLCRHVHCTCPRLYLHLATGHGTCCAFGPVRGTIRCGRRCQGEEERWRRETRMVRKDQVEPCLTDRVAEGKIGVLDCGEA